MADEYTDKVNRRLDDWRKTIEDIEEQAQTVSTFDKLELLARAERLRTRSREIERKLDLIEETDDETTADSIRSEIEAAESEVRKMLEDAESEARKRTDTD